jgi:hypothetical protein
LFDLDEVRQREKNATFYSETSDVFFAEHAAQNAPFDLIFLDGLHTFEQTLRDFLNTACVVEKHGVIVIDDVRPNSYASSLPDEAYSQQLKKRLGVNDTSWMGDVYKIVPFLDTFSQTFTFACPVEVPNCLVVWHAPRQADTLRHRDIAEISNFSFAQSVLEPGTYHSMHCDEIVAAISAAHPHAYKQSFS